MLKKLYVELTDGCNLHCSMCFRASWSGDTCTMSEACFSSLRAALPRLPNLEAVVIGGIGEPFGSPLFRQAVSVFGSYHLTVTTNGTLLEPELFPLLCEHVDVLVVSMDGGEAVFQQVRGTALAPIVQSLRELEAFKKQQGLLTPRLHLQMVLQQANVEEIWSVVDTAASLNCQRLVLSQVIPQRAEEKDQVLYHRAPNPQLQAFFRRVINYGRAKGVYISLPRAELKTERRCSFAEEQAVVVTSSGEVVPCYRLAHAGKEYVLGRVKDVLPYSYGQVENGVLEDLSTTKRYLELQRRLRYHQYPSCIDCDLVDGCDSVRNTEVDCYGNYPSCADCLWSRGFAQCP